MLYSTQKNVIQLLCLHKYRSALGIINEFSPLIFVLSIFHFSQHSHLANQIYLLKTTCFACLKQVTLAM